MRERERERGKRQDMKMEKRERERGKREDMKMEEKRKRERERERKERDLVGVEQGVGGDRSIEGNSLLLLCSIWRGCPWQ